MKIVKNTEHLTTSLEDDAEIKFLKRVRHPRLVLFLGCGMSPDGMFLALEFCEAGTLCDYLYGSKPGEEPGQLENTHSVDRYGRYPQFNSIQFNSRNLESHRQIHLRKRFINDKPSKFQQQKSHKSCCSPQAIRQAG